jgi:23S rRNA pseudouridine2605 synthase
VFDALPDTMPRVMSIGRLDLNSEGLLLLTNDGGIKRQLELPSTGWLRKYRVRIKGAPKDAELEPLRKGIEVEGVRYQPMQVSLDRQQGANAWLTIGLREGKNREIRRALAGLGFEVNRLIRISFGPFRLGTLAEGAVEEVRPRVMADQLGMPQLVEGHADPSKSLRKKPRGGPAPVGRPRPVLARLGSRLGARRVALDQFRLAHEHDEEEGGQAEGLEGHPELRRLGAPDDLVQRRP